VQPRDLISGPVYFGPDVAVFFSDAFLQTHCFRLIPGPDRTLVGLGFEPVKTRKVVDIEGVLWLDREQNRLRRLEYRYTALWPWVPKGSTGGRLDFEFLAGGQPVLTGWSIRAPVARIEDWSEGTRVRDGRRPVLPVGEGNCGFGRVGESTTSASPTGGCCGGGSLCLTAATQLDTFRGVRL
jgi:hypothetical protein